MIVSWSIWDAMDAKFVVIADRKNRNLIRRLNSWSNPGLKHRKLPPGTIEKVGSNAFLFSGTEEATRCVHFLLGRYAKEMRIFMVKKEATFKDDFLSGLGSFREGLQHS